MFDDMTLKLLISSSQIAQCFAQHSTANQEIKIYEYGYVYVVMWNMVMRLVKYGYVPSSSDAQWNMIMLFECGYMASVDIWVVLSCFVQSTRNLVHMAYQSQCLSVRLYGFVVTGIWLCTFFP